MQATIVLRDLQRGRLPGPFGDRRRADVGPSALGLRAPEPQIDVEAVDARGRTELLRDPNVVAVTASMPTRLVRPLDGGHAAADGDAWGVAAVKATESQFTGDGVVTAVLDTGVDAGHAAFAGVSLEQQDFSGSGDGDNAGHGTHCAGTILGRDVDAKRIGIARGVSRLLAGKVLRDDGGGSSEMAFQGMRWAMDRGAHVISMSLGFDFPGMVARLTHDGWPADLATSSALEAYRGNLRMFDALMDMIRANQQFGSGTGTVVVAAAGNESRRNVNPDYEIAASLPAAAEGVISVGAAGRNGDRFDIGYFSNTFPVVAAPGVDILSARAGGGLGVMSGTSMACPHVAGVAALWWEAIRTSGLPVRAETVVAKLMATARIDVFAPTVDIADRGTGLVTAP